MSEQALWQNLKTKMRGKWHVQRHEDRLSPGIPDLSFVCQGVAGWMELKYMEAWPKRADTLTDIGLSVVQKAWMDAYVKHGGLAFVLLQVGHGGGANAQDSGGDALWLALKAST